MQKQIYFSAVFLFFLFLTGVLSAQDRMVMILGDTLDCKITGVTPKYLYFERMQNGVVVKDRIDRADVREWSKTEQPEAFGQAARPVWGVGRFRIALSGGYGIRTANTKTARQEMERVGFTSQEAKKYYKKLQAGEQAGGQLHYMFLPDLGLGVDYHFYYASSSIYGNFDPQDGVFRFYGEISENIYTNFVGISCYGQQWLKPERLKAYSVISVGMALYRNETLFVYNPMLISGKALGENLDIGLEYLPWRNFAVGASVSCFQSTLRKVDVDNGISSQEVKLDKEQWEGLFRLSLSAGLKFYF